MRRAGLALLCVLAAAACSDDKSVVVVAVQSNAAPIVRAAQLRVRASNGGNAQDLLFPEQPRAEDALLTTPITFSMSFQPKYKGTVTFKVEVLDPAQNVVASGESQPEQLSVGQITYATVWVSPICDPLQPAVACGNGQNCAFVCDSQQQARTTCVAGGAASPGDVCGGLSDCAPGSECFGFTCSGTSIKTCRKFCANDSDCGAGATCISILPCGVSQRQAFICSRPCDPTGSAIHGCVAGLHCFIYEGGVTDCGCRAPTRTAEIGQACLGEESCSPGLACVEQGGQKTCRPLCALAAPSCPESSACTELINSVYKAFGVCL